MKTPGVLLVVTAIAALVVLAPLAWAAEVEGRIRSVDPSGRLVTLDDGTQLTIPTLLTVEKQALQPGASVKASYEEKNGQKLSTSFMVTSPARP